MEDLSQDDAEAEDIDTEAADAAHRRAAGAPFPLLP